MLIYCIKYIEELTDIFSSDFFFVTIISCIIKKRLTLLPRNEIFLIILDLWSWRHFKNLVNYVKLRWLLKRQKKATQEIYFNYRQIMFELFKLFWSPENLNLFVQILVFIWMKREMIWLINLLKHIFLKASCD